MMEKIEELELIAIDAVSAVMDHSRGYKPQDWNALDKKVQKDAKKLKSLLDDWDAICKRTGWIDSEVDGVWQRCIYGATLYIPVAIPTTLDGWQMWDDETSDEAMAAMIENTAAIIKIIYQYRYFGLFGSEKLMEVVRPYLWRVMD